MNRIQWIKRTAFVVMAVLVLAGCSKTGGKESPISDFFYILTDDGSGIKITGYTGKGGNVVIPSTIDDMPVLEIKERAFMGHADVPNRPTNRDAIISIVVPNSVELIGEDTFSYMLKLTKVTLPDSIKVISQNLFRMCPKLTSINLPANLEIIGAGAFLGCSELTELMIPTNITSIEFKLTWSEWGRSGQDNNSFLGCKKLPIKTRQTIENFGYTSGF